jgi:hypothetical protein
LKDTLASLGNKKHIKQIKNKTMPTEKKKKGFDASSITGIPKNPKAGKKT